MTSGLVWAGFSAGAGRFSFLCALGWLFFTLELMLNWILGWGGLGAGGLGSIYEEQRHAVSIYFVLEGLGFRGQALGLI